MKIAHRPLPYEEAVSRPLPPHRLPKKPGIAMRSLVRVLSGAGLAGSSFSFTRERMELIPKGQPCLILMNHSCFLDLMIVSKVFYPSPYAIVCTNDGFVGMNGRMEDLMRAVGCIPTRKFVTDLNLVRDMDYCLHELKESVLMYPEASYSFDGTATALPRKMGVLLKKLDVPVVMIKTQGAFTRNPLYNELKVRKNIPVSAVVSCLFSQQQVRDMSVQALSDGLDEAFSFDHFRWQAENNVTAEQEFRADGLHRILYQCPRCRREGTTTGKGISLTCSGCGAVYPMTPLGKMEQSELSHIPTWYRWERDNVRQEILSGSYRMETDVDIMILRDYEAVYEVGSGHLIHDITGFTLTGCEGKLSYHQKPQACYGLYADYYWYEIGDMVCIGDSEMLYYCFPKGSFPVAKTRLAAEEMYKLYKQRKLPGQKAAAE